MISSSRLLFFSVPKLCWVCFVFVLSQVLMWSRQYVAEAGPELLILLPVSQAPRQRCVHHLWLQVCFLFIIFTLCLTILPGCVSVYHIVPDAYGSQKTASDPLELCYRWL